jgi:regulator of sigma E protease
LTVVRRGGKQEAVTLVPHFAHPFGDGNNFNVAGMQPRMRVECVSSKESPVFGKLKPGDVIKSIAVRNPNTPTSQPGNVAPDVSVSGFIKSVGEAGAKDQSIDFTVIRDGKEFGPIKDVKATVRVTKDRKGVGVVPAFEDQTPVIAAVIPKSPADGVKDGLPIGSQIAAVDGKAVTTWFDVRDALQAAGGQHTLTLLPRDGGKAIERTINLSENDAQAVAGIRLQAPLHLAELITVRKTDSPATAMGWGVLETRDLILQFYVTLQRMFGGSISTSNLMGPVGIVNAGARFAFKGNDWLIWFLAMISANLAVVNFLPIPIVDGGLFLFLIIEKIQGKPLSRRAQEYAQLVGLALILSVFLMVTYNDIARMFGGH